MTDTADEPELTPPATPAWQRWLLIAFALLAIAGLAFAIGRFSTFGQSAAVSMPTTNSAEAGFARDMQVHHTQAIEMAMEIYRKTDDDDVRIVAYDIATTQAGQRGEMYGWLVSWGLPQAGGPLMEWMADADGGHSHAGAPGEVLTEAELIEAMGMASDAELAALAAATGTAADCLFLELMIRHHEGAIPMTVALLERGSDPRALVVAQQMKDAQTFEIDAMKSIQSRLACAA